MKSSIKIITTLIVCLLFCSLINGQIKPLKVEELSIISEFKGDSTKIIPILDYTMNIFNFIGIPNSSDVRMSVRQISEDEVKIEFYYSGFKYDHFVWLIETISPPERVFYYKNKRFCVISTNDNSELFFSKYFKDIGCINRLEAIPNYDINSPRIEINVLLLNSNFYIEDIKIEFPLEKNIIK